MATAKGNWFTKKSPEAQAAYIAAHPNSIHAKKAAGTKLRKPRPKRVYTAREKREKELQKMQFDYKAKQKKVMERARKEKAKIAIGEGSTVLKRMLRDLKKLEGNIGTHKRLMRKI